MPMLGPFTQFVTARAGGYFFAPSIQALASAPFKNE